jgi:hypothetical protein
MSIHWKSLVNIDILFNRVLSLIFLIFDHVGVVLFHLGKKICPLAMLVPLKSSILE